MKRIATIAAVLTAAALAGPSVAAAGNVTAQVKPQVTAQIVGAQVAKAQRVSAAVTAQRVTSQRVNAKRLSLLLRVQSH